MEGLELTAFQIISAVGTAKSSYIEAISSAKAGDFDHAEELIKEGDENFVEGHKAHAGLLEKEANGELGQLGLLMLHAEDQLMSAEAAKTFALEFIDSYKRIEKLEAKVNELSK
ncbi:MAG: PTS lactose/cellobiose transporter subunit IIA [Selenomonadaceae bacterium]|nr:PTS lactose/cellobiose transporter subunit IIA [Selenomonadaceae bacterium]